MNTVDCDVIYNRIMVAYHSMYKKKTWMWLWYKHDSWY